MSGSNKKNLPMPVLEILLVGTIVAIGLLVNQINPFTLSMILSMLLGIILVMAVVTFAYFRDVKRYRAAQSSSDDQDLLND